MTDISLSYRIPPEIMGAALSFDHREAALMTRDGLFSVLSPVIAVIVLYLYLFLSGVLEGDTIFAIALVVCVASFLFFIFRSKRRLYREISEEWGAVSLLLREEGLEITRAGAQA
ncbi:MAG: hypothetical protein LBD06_01180, partial [Candidatus Accumulibacter sp.]|nr:hypothetical protein [Accumulibacter sp.]